MPSTFQVSPLVPLELRGTAMPPERVITVQSMDGEDVYTLDGQLVANESWRPFPGEPVNRLAASRPAPARATANVTTRRGNPFDRFDPPSTLKGGANPFNRFDKALTDAGKRRGPNSFSDQATRAMTLGAQDLTNAGISAIMSQAPRLTGKDPGFGIGDAFQAARTVERGRAKAYEATKPVRGLTAGLVGGSAMPGGKAIGSFIEGGAGLLGQALRSAGVGAAIGGVNGLTTADPGHELQSGGQGALFGGLFGGAAPIAAKGAVEVGRKVIAPTVKTAVRAVNAASGGKLLDPVVEVTKRFAEKLKIDGATPEQVKSLTDAWRKTGASDPAFIDIISQLPSGGTATLGLIRGAALKSGPAQGAVKGYRAKISRELQPRVIARTSQLTPDARTVPQLQGEGASRIAAASEAPAFEQGQSGALIHKALNDRYDTAAAGVKSAYDAARAAAPEAAQIQELPRFAANVRDAVKDFDPDRVPSVTRELGRLDTLSTPTVRDIFELRSRLGNLRGSSDTVEAAAAGRAVQALDDQLGEAVDRGSIAGDPGVVDLWKTAIGARRDMGKAFEGKDLVHKLTERVYRGGTRTNAVAPEDAATHLLGANGVTPKLNATRDLSRIRDMLGAESPEWQALQGEAAGRLLTKDAGKPQYGDALERFRTQSPDLASTVISPDDLAKVSAAREGIAGAVGDQSAVETGTGILGKPAVFAAGLQPDRIGLTGTAGARTIEEYLGAAKPGAVGSINALGSENVGANLSATFGPDEAARYQEAMANETHRMNTANSVDPNINSRTALNLEDAADLPELPTSIMGVGKALLQKVLNGGTLTDAEREAIVQLGIGAPKDIPIPPAARVGVPVSSRLAQPLVGMFGRQ